jgi:hypothetical protein
MPNSNRQQSSGSGQSGKSLAVFGLGAVAGALAAGAAWYFSEEEQPHRQQQRYQPNHPSYQADLTTPSQNATDKEDDEKDGTVKSCEICFSSFVELKQCGVEIVTTPCGHLYCRQCIMGALSVKPECPHCRSEVREETLTRIYM